MNWINLKYCLVVLVFILILKSPVPAIATKRIKSAPDLPDSFVNHGYTIRSLQNDSLKRSAVLFRNYGFRPFNHLDSMLLFLPDGALNAAREKQQLRLIRLMAEGKIPIGFFNLDYNKLFGYNLFEGVKIGLGGETNGKLSHHFSIGGAFSYGLKTGQFSRVNGLISTPGGSPT